MQVQKHNARSREIDVLVHASAATRALAWSAFFAVVVAWIRGDPCDNGSISRSRLKRPLQFYEKNLCLYINGLQTFSRQGHPKIMCIWPQTCILKYVVQGTPTSKEFSLKSLV